MMCLVTGVVTVTSELLSDNATAPDDDCDGDGGGRSKVDEGVREH